MELSIVGRAAALAVGALTMLACGQKTGLVRTGPHLLEKEPAPIAVDEQPPPVKVEAVPLRRNNECSYVDGAWTTEGGPWTWKKGEWILPPPACYYAPPQTRYEALKSGTALVHRPGAWHPLGRIDFDCQAPRPCPPPDDTK